MCYVALYRFLSVPYQHEVDQFKQGLTSAALQQFNYTALLGFAKVHYAQGEGFDRFSSVLQLMDFAPVRGETHETFLQRFQQSSNHVFASVERGGFGESIPTKVLALCVLILRLGECTSFQQLLKQLSKHKLDSADTYAAVIHDIKQDSLIVKDQIVVIGTAAGKFERFKSEYGPLKYAKKRAQAKAARIGGLCDNCRLPGHSHSECKFPGGGATDPTRAAETYKPGSLDAMNKRRADAGLRPVRCGDVAPTSAANSAKTIKKLTKQLAKLKQVHSSDDDSSDIDSSFEDEFEERRSEFASVRKAKSAKTVKKKRGRMRVARIKAKKSYCEVARTPTAYVKKIFTKGGKDYCEVELDSAAPGHCLPASTISRYGSNIRKETSGQYVEGTAGNCDITNVAD